jgi:flagellar protein FliL
MGSLNKKKFFNLILVIVIVGLIMFLAINSSSCSLFKKKAATAVTNADGSAVTNADGSNVTTVETEKTPETKKEEKKKEEKKEFGPTFDLGEIIVNLSDAGQARYAKMSVAFELDAETTLEEATKMDPLIRDIVVELLSGETSEKILSLAARNDLKQRIMERVNDHFAEGKILQVFFTNVLVQ